MMSHTLADRRVTIDVDQSRANQCALTTNLQRLYPNDENIMQATGQASMPTIMHNLSINVIYILTQAPE